MAPIMASPLRSKSLDMVPLLSSKKRARSSEDDSDEAPRVDKKVGITRIAANRCTQIHHYKPRPLPFRASPTSQHSLAFSQTKKPRPTSLVTPLGFQTTPAPQNHEKRHSYPFQTPPRSKSPSKPGFSDAFSTFRDPVDSDTDMADSPMSSPMTVSASTTEWSSPATSPEDCEAPKAKQRNSFFKQITSTPTSPKSSRTYLMTPPPPRPSRFAFQPPPKPVNGQRLPTPTYGHFPLSNRGELSTPDVSPKTHSNNKSAILRRGLPTLLPPSPISETEFESPTAAGMGDLLSRLQMNSSPSDGRGKNSSDNGNPARAKQGRRMAVDQGRLGVDHQQGQTTTTTQSGKGEKTTLAMGYRGDCEKCRARVPGHFNHFVKRL
ncbi:hypothetical protein G7Y79_00041g077680 [Physcia stellaris]|nr:hypothetical protein G7Y79_00041g077680 [Physcia stellaris]